MGLDAGNLEANEAMMGGADVLVADGFTGNVARASEDPWALITGLEIPRKGVPPISPGSSSLMMPVMEALLAQNTIIL